MVAPAGGPPTHPPAALAGGPAPLSRRDRAYLSRTAAAVRVRLRSAATDMMAAGKLLLEARRRVGRGTFVAWLRSEAGPGVKKTTAYRLMDVAEAFGGLPAEVLRNIPKGTLYVLAQPEVPRSLREFVVQEAQEGKTITQTDALRWIAEQRRQDVEPDARYKAAPGVARPKDDPAAAHAADNWLALGVLLKPGVTLHVNHLADEENGERTVSVMVLDGGRVRSTTRATLEDAVVELAGLRRMRVCRACLEPKRLDEFSRLKDGPGGRNRACLHCERERVAEATRAKSVFPIGKNGAAEDGRF